MLKDALPALLTVVVRIDALEYFCRCRGRGLSVRRAARRAAQHVGRSYASVMRWRDLVRGAPRHDWPRLLLPKNGRARGRTVKIPSLEAGQLRSADELQRLLGEANQAIEQLQRDLAHATSHASTALAVRRHGRRPLGPEEFAAIRGSSLPRAQLILRFRLSRRTIEKIQYGTYQGVAFRTWLAEVDQGPDRANNRWG